MDIQEGNKLIAEFMGYRQRENGGLYWGNEGLGGIYIEEMKYHSSWDWLMPVVEKIEDLAVVASFNINSTTITIEASIEDEDATFKNIEVDVNYGKLLAVWAAVIIFLKWYYKN